MPRPHAKIATGKSENKFGIPISRARDVYAHAGKLQGIRVTGVDMHIGSQITDLQPFDDAFALLSPISCARCAPMATTSSTSISAAASAFRIARTTSRRRDPTAYAAVVKRATRDLGCKLIFEPGRLIVGNAGILVTQVHLREARRGQELRHRRRGDERPHPPDALRGAPRHPRRCVRRRRAPRAYAPTSSARCARPATTSRSTATCRKRKPGDLLALMTAGAYGAVQAGTYNTRALVARGAGQRRPMGGRSPAPRCRRA